MTPPNANVTVNVNLSEEGKELLQEIREANAEPVRTSIALAGGEARVDQAGKVIRDASVIELGQALGHPFDNDATTLAQVRDLGNANAAGGPKIRLSHPDACNDGTGRELGRARNFRFADASGNVLDAVGLAEGQVPEGTTRVLADLHLADFAENAPEGDLAGWLLAVAEEDPAIVGLSIHGKGVLEKRLDADGEPLVVDGVPARPVLRLSKLVGVDVVDQPAANRSGLFAASEWAQTALETALEGVDAIETVDELAELCAGQPALVALAQADVGTIRLHTADAPVDLDRAAGFVNRFLARHGTEAPSLDANAVRGILQRLHKETLTMTKQNTPADPAVTPDPQAPTDPVTLSTADRDKLVADATAAENQRQSEIRALGTMFTDPALEPIIAECAGDSNVSLDEARRRVMEKLAEMQSSAGGQGTVLVGAEASEKLAAQATDAILLNHNIKLGADDDAMAERVREANGSGLRGHGPKQIARIILQQAGAKNVDRLSDDALFELSMGGAAFDSGAAGTVRQFAGVGHSTGDFPAILANTANKAMIQGYDLSPVTWDRWCGIGNLRDFKTHDRNRLSEAPLLVQRPEGQPAEQGTFNEQREQITLKNYAKGVSYTRQMFVNDDLGAFLGLMQRMGAGANYTLEVAVYTNLTANGGVGPTMSDSNALFHTDHDNLAAVGAAPTQAELEKVVAAMMAQGGIGEDGDNVVIGVAPTIYLGNTRIAMIIEKIIRSQYAGSDGRRDPQLQALVDAIAIKVPMLGKLGREFDWYGVAPQGLAPSYEVGFLNGVRTPRTMQQNHHSIDGTTIITSLDYAVHPTGGWQGIYRNPGADPDA